MRQSNLTRAPVFLRAFGCIAFFGLFLLSCAGVPSPRDTEESLALFYPLTGSAALSGEGFREPLHLEPDSNGLAWAALKPGAYSLVHSEESDSQMVDFEIVPGSIQLVGPRPLTTDEQRRSLDLLMEYLSFPEWVGRDLAGFGPHTIPPVVTRSSGELLVASDPPGAAVYIDDANYGTTPFRIVLSRGRYKVRLNLEGRADLEEVVELDQRLEFSRTLPTASNLTGRNQSFKMLLVPFSEAGGQGIYSNVIADTLALNFRQGDVYRTEVLKTILPLEAAFDAAEAAAADILVEGWYQQDAQGLVLRAVVWDVRTRRIRYMELFPVPGGLRVFDALDEGSTRFAANALRELPKPGDAVVENIQLPKGALLPMEQEGYRQWQVYNRDGLEGFASLGYSLGVSVPGFATDVHRYTYQGVDYSYSMGGGFSGFDVRGGVRFGAWGGPVLGVTGLYGSGGRLGISGPSAEFTAMHLFLTAGYAFHIRQGGLLVYLMPVLMTGTLVPLQIVAESGFPAEGFDGLPMPLHLLAAGEAGLQFRLNPKNKGSSLYLTTILKNFLVGWSILGNESQPFKSMTNLTVGLGWEWVND